MHAIIRAGPEFGINTGILLLLVRNHNPGDGRSLVSSACITGYTQVRDSAFAHVFASAAAEAEDESRIEVESSASAVSQRQKSTLFARL